MSMIYLVIGLPGSGKTTFLKTVDGLVVDDITDLKSIPETFENLYISDINFCVGTEKAEEYLSKFGHKIVKIFYENEPEKCIINVNNRNDGRLISEQFIRFLSKQYVIPSGATVLEVYDASKQRRNT